MRYIDAYELIQAGLKGKISPTLPLTENLMSEYYDRAVQDVGKRVTKDIGIYSYNEHSAYDLVTDGTNALPYTIGYKHSRGFLINTPITFLHDSGDLTCYTHNHSTDTPWDINGNSIFKVERDGKAVPFIGEDRVLTTNTDTSTEDYQLGWWLWHEQKEFELQTILQITPQIQWTYFPTHVFNKGERIRFSGLVGGPDNYRESLNKETHYIYDDSEGLSSSTKFEINLSLGGSDDSFNLYRGIVRTDNWWMMFNQVPSVSDDIKLWYYKLPSKKRHNDNEVDLPDTLSQACVYHAMGHLTVLGGGDMQIASGLRGMARSMEREYTDTYGAREPMPDIIPNPLPDFNYTT